MTPQTATLKQKLITAIMATSLTVVVLTCSAFITYEYFSFRKAAVKRLTLRAEMLGANCAAALAFRNEADAAAVLSVLARDPYTLQAALYDRESRLFARYPGDAAMESFPAQPKTTEYRFNNDSFILFHPIVNEGRTIGTFYLRWDLKELRKTFQIYSLVVALVIAASTALAFLLSNRLQKRISQPILALANTARHISEANDFSVRAPKLSNDEIGLLTDSFNGMLREIQQRDASLRKNDIEIRKLNADLENRVQQRTQALEQANKELEAFSYSVSHDLRAPLRHVVGFLDLLKKKAGTALDPHCQRYVETISDAAKEMGQLIDDLLSFSRMGRAEIRAAHVDTGALVSETINDLKLETQDREISWQVQPLPAVHADPALLKQVWTNLLSNAVKYTGHRDKALIEIGTLPGKQGEHVFFVRDNGAGFDMQFADKLFGVFQRLHRADEFQGTGIGLANVRRIVSRHGGRTWAEGKVGAGATFYFSLPEWPAVCSDQSSLVETKDPIIELNTYASPQTHSPGRRQSA